MNMETYGPFIIVIRAEGQGWRWTVALNGRAGHILEGTACGLRYGGHAVAGLARVEINKIMPSMVDAWKLVSPSLTDCAIFEAFRGVDA